MIWQQITEAELNSFWQGAEQTIQPVKQKIDNISHTNQAKVLRAFQNIGVSDFHFNGSTGYGYGDMGREVLESLFATVFGSESSLVRNQIVSGTHAISLCLFGNLKPGDELVSIGSPYDTLQQVIGISGSGEGSLLEWGITYKEIPFDCTGQIDLQKLSEAIGPHTKMVSIQRSRGYQDRPSLNISQMEKIIQHVKALNPDIICFVDNCYGEFVEDREPPEVGADLVAGSLIKNPGGGLAPAGGYIVGKKELVTKAAYRLTAPGIGPEVGASPMGYRLLFQGLFLAPHIVGEAIKGAVFTACLMEKLGFRVYPRYNQPRTDIIQAIEFGSPDLLVAFCQGLQSGSPVDSHVLPEPALLPGYTDKVIMAAGTFVQGASIELSADAPIRPPYTLFLQGGLTESYIKLGVAAAVKKLLTVAKERSS